jgi:branched-chain amino acid transport system permease protein
LVLNFEPGPGTGLATWAPMLLTLITVAELLFVIGFLVAVIVLIIQGLRWRQLPEAVKSEQVLLPDMVDHSRRLITIYISVALLLFVPILLGSFPSEVMVNVGLYVIMGLGLNILVGFAGLLDLGYVAFFAVGAYTTALLTSPNSALQTSWTFWQAIPIVFVVTALAGLLVGTPVLRMRGDYLAIVTLGLGEIARFLALSDWLRPYFGGAQGILNIPKPIIAGIEFSGPQKLYYLLLAGSLVALFIAWRVKDSRVGRAWMAMREDEDVADVMGINTTQYKLMAFGMGATIASFSGAIFAAKIGSVFPHSFNVLVSITALSLLIIGGIGSLPGVIVGALALVGIPELLREFTEYRLLIYGAVLIIMMLTRPEGLIPSRQRARELHDEERSQDAWLRTPQPAASTLSTNPGSPE